MDDESLKFEWWFAQHKTACGAAELKVTWQIGKDAIFVVVLCPRCDESIRGFIDNSDWPRVVALFDHTRDS